MKEINADRFIWEDAGISCSYHVFDFISDTQPAIRINKDKYIPIGWCDSIKLHVRPRTRQIAILFDILDEDEIQDKVWLHFPDIFKKLFECD